MREAINESDLLRIQAIREDWDRVTEDELADLREYLGEGVTEYQLWLELRCARAQSEPRL